MVLSILATLLRRVHREQRGQVLWLTAFLISVLGGMTAIAVDIGGLSAHRRDLQNDADAIALAASLELPNETNTRAKANEWAGKNGVDPAQMTVTIIHQNPPTEPNPKVRVELEDGHDFTFARLIGISSGTVAAKAAAIKSSASGGENVVPLGVTQNTLLGVGLGDEVVLRYDFSDSTNGNTGPIRIDGGGVGNCSTSNAFCDGVMYGSENVVCAEGVDSGYCDGPTTADTQPGNLIGAMRDSIDYRLDHTDAECDEFTEVFEDDPTTDEPDVWRIVEECNPYLVGGYDSLRVIIVPVIEQLCNGSCEVTIVDFALFFLEGFGNGGCTGNDCEIIGRFVRVNQSVGLLAGTFDPSSFNSFVRLVE